MNLNWVRTFSLNYYFLDFFFKKKIAAYFHNNLTLKHPSQSLKKNHIFTFSNILKLKYSFTLNETQKSLSHSNHIIAKVFLSYSWGVYVKRLWIYVYFLQQRNHPQKILKLLQQIILCQLATAWLKVNQIENLYRLSQTCILHFQPWKYILNRTEDLIGIQFTPERGKIKTWENAPKSLIQLLFFFQ